ncbi:porin [Pseudomonas sp. R5(2019)]|nr:porin [Pseudomonas sp. R5(2019)]
MTLDTGASRKRPYVLALPILTSLLTYNAAAQAAFEHDSAWMLGDWGGLRKTLQNDGYTFNIGYTGEVASNVAGGYSDRTTARYADQLMLGTTLDLQKIFGWSDAEFQLTITERTGHNLSGEGIGDPRTGTLSSVQEIYGRGQTWRLTQAWYRQAFFDGDLDFKFGRVTVNEDFGTFSCKFQNLAFCGAQIGNWAGDIIYTWPVSQWGGRVKMALGDSTDLQVGIYEQNPSYLETGNGFKLSGSGNRGVLVPIELVHQIRLGAENLPGEYRIGAYRSSATADDVYRAEDGQAQPSSTAQAKSHDGKYGAWIVAQQQMYRDPVHPARGLTLFANGTVHDKATSKISRYIQVGAFYTSPFDSRPDDEIGLGLANIHVNDRYRARQELDNEINGLSDYNDPAFLPPQGSETNVEIYYGIAATRWLTVRPNLQFIARPGGVSAVNDAWVAGLKFETSL